MKKFIQDNKFFILGAAFFLSILVKFPDYWLGIIWLCFYCLFQYYKVIYNNFGYNSIKTLKENNLAGAKIENTEEQEFMFLFGAHK